MTAPTPEQIGAAAAAAALAYGQGQYEAGQTEQAAIDQPKLDAAQAQVTASQQAAAALQTELAAAAAAIGELQAELDALVPPVVYGSGVGGWWETLKEPKAAAYARITAAFGGHLPIVRLFASSVPSYVDPATRVSLDTGDMVTAAQVKALAARQGDQFLSVAHEPNKTGKSWTPASWGAQQRAALGVVQANSAGNVHLVPTLEGQAFIPGRKPPLSAAQWFSGWDLTGIDYIGADLYQWAKDDASADSALTVIGGAIELAKSLGKKLVINELGSRRPNPPYSPGISDGARAKFLGDVVALCDANREHVAAVMLFESDNGTVGMTPWPITHPTNAEYSPLAVAAWRAACMR